jgi:hypothetical protein
MAQFTNGHTKMGGRQAGTPNKRTQRAKDWARELVEDSHYLDSLQQRLVEGTLAPQVEALLLQYAYGRPTDLQADGSVLPKEITIRF